MGSINVEGFERLAAQAASEGAVLLKNEGNVLPLRDGDRVAVFGRTQIDYYRSGTGSGGAVKVAYTTDILNGLRRQDNMEVNEELAGIYEKWIRENPFDNGGGGWAAEPWYQKDMPLDEDIVKAAGSSSDKALYIIGRTAGEDKDNAEEEGSYLLTSLEKENIKKITEVFEQVVVVLNVSNIIDMSFFEEEGHADRIKGILYIWQGGMEGGNAAADVLTGKAVPGGKLPDTIAYRCQDYPSSSNNGGMDRNLYQEDIYVGYRYFETFCPQKVMYEFGYGLSYTTFEIQENQTKILGTGKDVQIAMTVKVKNTGDTYTGKEVVQVYCEAPQGQLGRPVKQLAAFAKTKELAPGEETDVMIRFAMADMAAYDDSGVTGHKSCYVLEAGEYAFYVGNSVRNLKRVSIAGGTSYRIPGLIIVNQLEEALAPTEAFTRMKPGQRKPDGTYDIVYEEVPRRTVDLEERIWNRLPQAIPQTGNRGYCLQDVSEGKITLETFVAQLTEEELAVIVRGEGMGHPGVTPGTASAFGGISDSLREYGLPLACAADGPSGIRMESGRCAVQLPIGTLLATTWNTELVKELYTFEGKELVLNQVDTLLGPGINIHRSPLNGRNFEYYSEDPLLTGAMAAAASAGIHDGGSHATIKHFACNSQEKRRSFVDAVVSERALREIYLKGFEMAVRFGNAVSVMTSYNPINGHYAASNYDLNTTLLRGEWGFTGIVMTDWWAKMNGVTDGGEGVKSRTADMIRAQNDLYMVVNNYGAEVNANQDDTLEALKQGRLTVGEMQRCAMNICRFLMNSQAYESVGNAKAEVLVIEPLETEEAMSIEAQNIAEDSVVRIGMGEEAYVHITVPGEYYLITSIMSPDSNLFQNSGRIMMNGQEAAFIQTQGTKGKWITQKLNKIILKEGFYRIQPEVLKPHMEMRQIEFAANRNVSENSIP